VSVRLGRQIVRRTRVNAALPLLTK
jgi:hypothetical protein